MVGTHLFFGLIFETILKGKKKENYKRILSIFNEINKVPRPSGHEEKMVLYLESFAKSHNLKYIIIGKTF